jgi:hypothetical protein
MSVTAVITTGTTELEYPDRRIRRTLNDLNEVSHTFQRSTSGALLPGAAMPGMSGYILQSVVETKETDDCYVYDCTAMGVLNGVITFDRVETENEEGFDEASLTYLSSTKMYAKRGQALPGNGAMICTNVQRRQHPVSPSYWFNDCTFRGQLNQNQVKVRWGNAGREISKDGLIVNFTGGWADPRKSNILWGRSSCTLSYVSLALPQKGVPTQSGSAPHYQAPFVFNPSLTLPTEEITWNWPNGWTLADLNVDIIPGTSICFVTEGWVYNNVATF